MHRTAGRHREHERLRVGVHVLGEVILQSAHEAPWFGKCPLRLRRLRLPERDRPAEFDRRLRHGRPASKDVDPLPAELHEFPVPQATDAEQDSGPAAGMHRPGDGEHLIPGQRARPRGPLRRQRHGRSRVHGDPPVSDRGVEHLPQRENGLTGRGGAVPGGQEFPDPRAYLAVRGARQPPSTPPGPNARIAALEARSRRVNGPDGPASPEVSALAAELFATYRGPQTPDTLARRMDLARRAHDLLPMPDLPPSRQPDRP